MSESETTIGKKLRETLSKSVVKDQEKLKKQQEYYKELSSKGVAQKQTYSLKPLSAI